MKKPNETPTEMKGLFWQMLEDFESSELAKLKKENEDLKKTIGHWEDYCQELTEEHDKYKKMVGELTEKNEDLELHLANYKFIAQSSSCYADKQSKELEEMRCLLHDGGEYLEEMAKDFKRMAEDDDPDWME